MKVREAREQAGRWAKEFAANEPNVIAIHSMGSINYLPPGDEFAAFRDIDMNVVSTAASGWTVHNLEWNGLLIEYGLVSAGKYESAEKLLASPELAGNVSQESILYDKTGQLTEISRAVESNYRDPKWILARCDSGTRAATEWLEKGRQAAGPLDELECLWFATGFLAGLPALATLAPLTHRRGLVIAKTVLSEHGHDEMYQRLLGLLGLDRVDTDGCVSLLEATATAYDMALSVQRTPTPYSFKLQPRIRTYAVDGAKDMIEEGHVQEAVHWILAFVGVAAATLSVDGDDADREQATGLVRDAIHLLGLDSPGEGQTRIEAGRALAAELRDICDSLIPSQSD